MTTLTHVHTNIQQPSAPDARRYKAMQLRTEGLKDAEIAERLTRDEPHGSKRIISADEVWRMCRQVEREQRAE